MILNGAIASSRRRVSIYDFPILSTDATTFDIADWTTDRGNLYQKDSGVFFVMSNTTDRSRHYQTFSIPTEFNAAIDAGNGRIDLSHTVYDFASDVDGGIAFVEWYDGGASYLGRSILEHVNNTATSAGAAYFTENAGELVPPGARSCRIGWQGYRESGAESSWYPTDLQCTLYTDTTYNDAVLLFGEKGADATGWSGTPTILTDAADWENAMDDPCYSGGPSNAYREVSKNFSIPAGWLARVAAGDVDLVFRSSVFSANNNDRVNVVIEFDPGGTPTTEATGNLSSPDIRSGDLLVDVPVGATDFDLKFQFTRIDGAYNDGAIHQISMWLVET